MLSFLLRRLLSGVLVLGAVSLVVFVLFFVVAPGEPAANFVGRNATPAQLEQARALYGLDQPVHVQYVRYVGRLLQGDLGFSFRNREPVLDTILSRLPVTASLVGGAAVLWLLVGVPLGVLAARRPRGVRDRLATLVALAGLSLPTFVVGLVLLYVFFFLLRTRLGVDLFPGGGYVPLSEGVGPWARHLLLPWVTLAFVSVATYSRVTRSAVLDALGEDYVRTARAKGLSERRVVYVHALRGALVPVVTLLGLDVGALLGGALVTESVFGLQGVGQVALLAVGTRDLPVVLGTVLFASFFVVVASFVVDVLYALLDPRVRLR